MKEYLAVGDWDAAKAAAKRVLEPPVAVSTGSKSSSIQKYIPPEPELVLTVPDTVEAPVSESE